MKWLFILLLVINLAIFAWSYQREQQVPEAPVAAGTDIGKMRLLTEKGDSSDPVGTDTTSEETQQDQTLSSVIQEISEEEKQSGAQDMPGEDPDVVRESSPEVVQNEQDSAAQEDTAPAQPGTKESEPEVAQAVTREEPGLASEQSAQSEPEPDQPEETAKVSQEQPVPEPESEPESKPAGDEVAWVPETTESNKETEGKTEQKSVPVEEKPRQVAKAEDPAPGTTMAELTELQRPVADDAPASREPQTTSRCGNIGPLKDKKIARKILEDLKKNKIDADLEQSIKKQQIGYWVVIPPLADGSQAQAKLEELSQAGLKDIWHFRGGELKNAISLGMFSKKENADNYSREVLKRGFPTKIQPRYLNRTHYLVKFNITRPKTVTRIMWRMVERKYSRLPFSEQSCAPIASR